MAPAPPPRFFTCILASPGGTLAPPHGLPTALAADPAVIARTGCARARYAAGRRRGPLAAVPRATGWRGRAAAFSSCAAPPSRSRPQARPCRRAPAPAAPEGKKGDNGQACAAAGGLQHIDVVCAAGAAGPALHSLVQEMLLYAASCLLRVGVPLRPPLRLAPRIFVLAAAPRGVVGDADRPLPVRAAAVLH